MKFYSAIFCQLLLLTSLLSFASESTFTDCNKKPLIERILARPKFPLLIDNGFALSPNGKQVVYVVKKPKQKPLPSPRFLSNGTPSSGWSSQLMLSDLGTKTIKEVCPKDTSCFRPSWSPDGNWIAFYSDEGGGLGLWEFDLKKNQRRQLLNDRVRASLWSGDEPQWSLDSKKIFIGTRSPENLRKLAEESFAKSQDQVRVFRTTLDKSDSQQEDTDWNDPQEHYRRENLGNIVEVDRTSGTVQTLVPETAQVPPGVFQLSPSQKWISYLWAQTGRAPNGHMTRQLVIVPRSGGIPTLVAADLPFPDWDYNTRTYRWHPKRDLLVFVKAGRLWKLDLDSGSLAPKALRPEIHDAIDDPLCSVLRAMKF